MAVETPTSWENALSHMDAFLAQDGVHLLELNALHSVEDGVNVARRASLKAASARESQYGVVYLLPTLLESQIALVKAAASKDPNENGKRPLDKNSLWPKPGELAIMCFSDFVELCDAEGDCLPRQNLVFVAEGDLAMSQSAALAHILIAGRMRDPVSEDKQPISVHLILITIASIERAFYRGLTESSKCLQITKVDRAQISTKVDENDLAALVIDAADCIRDGQNVISFLGLNETSKIMAAAQGKYRMSDTTQSPLVSRRPETSLVTIDCETGFDDIMYLFSDIFPQPAASMFIVVGSQFSSVRLPIRNVGMVITARKMSVAEHFDKVRRGLIVASRKPYSKIEVVVQESYTGRSHFCTYTDAMYNELPTFPDPRFLDDEIYSFVFELVCRYPGRQFYELDLGVSEDGLFRMVEISRRLIHMGLIRPEGSGFAPVGSVKERLRSLLLHIPYNFNVCALMCRIDGLPTPLQRILIRLGAIAIYGHGLAQLKEQMTKEGREIVLLESFGPLRQLAWQGGLWATLGLFEMVLRRAQASNNLLGPIADNEVTMDENSVGMVRKCIRKVEEIFGLDAIDLFGYQGGILANDGLEVIQERLMRAYFDKLVHITLPHPGEEGTVSDLMSFLPLCPDERGFYVADFTRQMAEQAGDTSTSYLGIATAFQTQKTTGKIYAFGLTLLPLALGRIIQEESGHRLMDAAMLSTYYPRD